MTIKCHDSNQLKMYGKKIECYKKNKSITISTSNFIDPGLDPKDFISKVEKYIYGIR